MERIDILDRLYSSYEEDARLSKSRQGQLEYLTTMHYIHRLVPAGARVLELGAGTGRYSVALAKEGYAVTAVELLAHNLEILRRNAAGAPNITCAQGDATELSAFAADSFDAVLLFGPMYHLYTNEEQHRALDEAIRVAKPGGVVMAAVLSIWAVKYTDYLQDKFGDGLRENFDAEGRVRHFAQQVFTGFDIAEFEALFAGKPVQKLALAGTDSILELAEGRAGFRLSDEDFGRFAAFHLKTCEKRELLGSQSHLLYICRKNAAAAAEG